MKHSLLNLLCSSLIPELCANIPTGTSRNTHLVLVSVAAVRAFPDQLSVLVSDDLDLSGVTALLAIFVFSSAYIILS